jgi:hypothetical protein
MAMSARSLQNRSNLRIPSSSVVSNLGQALPGLGIASNRVSNGLGVDEESLLVEVVDIIANLVVVDVVSDTSLTAELLGLLLGLELLGAGEETAGGNAVLDEGGVVGAAAEFRGDVAKTLGLEEALKVLLDGVGSSGAGEVEGASVTVVDTVDIVRAGNLEVVSILFC